MQNDRVLRGCVVGVERALSSIHLIALAARAVTFGTVLMVAAASPVFAQTVLAPTVPQVATPAPPTPPSPPKAKAKAKTEPNAQAGTSVVPGAPPAARNQNAAKVNGNAAKAGGGGLNLDLRAQEPEKKPAQKGVADSPGTFAASGPYASQALINRVTGKIKQGELPKAPISLGGAGSADQNVGPIWAR
ncbi:MAG: hypothetical protein K2X10_08655 [Hyphomicrobiales bacterium]|nr:hypothetical protein [Hyphomicrobiales bacterium]